MNTIFNGLSYASTQNMQTTISLNKCYRFLALKDEQIIISLSKYDLYFAFEKKKSTLQE